MLRLETAPSVYPYNCWKPRTHVQIRTYPRSLCAPLRLPQSAPQPAERGLHSEKPLRVLWFRASVSGCGGGGGRRSLGRDRGAHWLCGVACPVSPGCPVGTHHALPLARPLASLLLGSQPPLGARSPSATPHPHPQVFLWPLLWLGARLPTGTAETARPRVPCHRSLCPACLSPGLPVCSAAAHSASSPDPPLLQLLFRGCCASPARPAGAGRDSGCSLLLPGGAGVGGG